MSTACVSCGISRCGRGGGCHICEHSSTTTRTTTTPTTTTTSIRIAEVLLPAKASLLGLTGINNRNDNVILAGQMITNVY